VCSVLDGKKILFLVTEDWYFVSHRLPIARAARDAGMVVHVATRVADHGDIIRREGFQLHPLQWKRRGAGPWNLIASLIQIRKVLKSERPNILHAVALKAVLFGAVATMGLRTRRIFAIAGLGFAFTDTSIRGKWIRALMRTAFIFAVDRRDATVLLQNQDDGIVLSELGFVRSAKKKIIAGSGVDARHFVPLPEPDGTITIAVVSRMISIKGIADLVAASHILRDQGIVHRLLLVGDPDPSNPSTIPPAKLREWSEVSWIEWAGASSDVRHAWAQAHIAVLTSLGGEGLPKTLLEAAACGRPLVATDVAGNRDIVVDGVTGFLARPQDPKAIATALARLVVDPDLRVRMGIAARARVEKYFTQDRIASETLALYADVVEGKSPCEHASV
jgi:glycosyltransferase involved in cell wall biosynthesis